MLKTMRVKYQPFYALEKCIPPTYSSEYASGADLTALHDFHLQGQAVTLIPTNLSVEIPSGYELQVRPRSGFSSKHNIIVINSPGTIDSDYRGEIKVALFNLDNFPKLIREGQKFAQLVLAPVLRAVFVPTDALSDTMRGEGGFGSTDIVNVCPRCNV